MKNFTLYLILLITWGCSEKIPQEYVISTATKKNITLQKINSIRINTPDSIIIADLEYAVAISPDGSRMAFFDDILKRIIVTDRSGTMITAVGGEGRGPEELMRVSGWTFNEDNELIVYDWSQRLIKIFSTEGKLKKAYSFFGNETLVTNTSRIYSRNSLTYSGVVEAKYAPQQRWQSKMLVVMNYQGERIKLIGKYDPYLKVAPLYMNTPLFRIDFQKSKVYTTHKNSYRVQIYDLKTGERLAYFGYISSSYNIAEEKINPFAPSPQVHKKLTQQSITEDLYITSNYILHNFTNITEKFNKTRNPQYINNFITIYDKRTHSYLAEVRLPYFLAEVYKDRLYLIENDHPENFTVGVYELEM